MHFPVIRIPVKSPVDDLFSGPYILTVLIFVPNIPCRIQGNRALHPTIPAKKLRSLSFSLRSAGRAYAARPTGMQFYQLDGIYPAFVCQTFPDVSPEASRYFPVRRFGTIFRFVFHDRSGNDNHPRFFTPEHPVDLGIDKIRCAEPVFFFLSVVFGSAEIIGFYAVRFFSVAGLPALYINRIHFAALFVFPCKPFCLGTDQFVQPLSVNIAVR